MAKRQSTFEDLIDISATFPWWVGVILAAVAYGIFHWIAGWEVGPVKGLQGLGDVFGTQLARTLALFLQYLVPVAFVIGAAISAYGQRKRSGLLSRTAASGDSKSFHDMSWREFELLVGEAFRAKGFRVQETGRSGPDGGVDLVLLAGSEKYLVQCKRWRALKVDVSTVRDLYGVMAATGASGGFVVSAGEFTKDAAAFAAGRNVELISQRQLMAMIQDTRSGTAQSKASEAGSNLVGAAIPSNRPKCPKCGSEMTERVAKQGANAGKSFWGCSTYPKCHGIVPIAS